MPDISSFMSKNQKRNADPKSSIHSLELVLTMTLFLIAGRFLDSQFETSPFLTLILGFVGIFGGLASAYYRYKATSEKLDEGKVWSEKKERVPAPTIVEEDEGLVVPKGFGNDD